MEASQARDTPRALHSVGHTDAQRAALPPDPARPHRRPGRSAVYGNDVLCRHWPVSGSMADLRGRPALGAAIQRPSVPVLLPPPLAMPDDRGTVQLAVQPLLVVAMTWHAANTCLPSTKFQRVGSGVQRRNAATRLTACGGFGVPARPQRQRHVSAAEWWHDVRQRRAQAAHRWCWAVPCPCPCWCRHSQHRR